MKTMTFEETKQVELEILTNVAQFCEKHNLRYFLAYGTLIGAIRHKGFIPWDDDIDIHMPREDYNRFCELYNKDAATEHFRAVLPNEKISRHPFVKVIDTRTVKTENNIDYSNGYLGVDVDIFPLDGQPDDDQAFAKWHKKLKKQYYYFPFFTVKKDTGLKWRLAVPIMKLLSGGKRKVLKTTARLHKLYPFETSKFVGAIESLDNSSKNRYRKGCFDGFVMVEFEGRLFRAPVGYDEVLTRVYGDYMKLPPIEQQQTHHGNNTYWLEEDNEKI